MFCASVSAFPLSSSLSCFYGVFSSRGTLFDARGGGMMVTMTMGATTGTNNGPGAFTKAMAFREGFLFCFCFYFSRVSFAFVMSRFDLRLLLRPSSSRLLFPVAIYHPLSSSLLVLC